MADKLKPATSPYNFISLPQKVICRYHSMTDLPVHNKIYSQEEGYYSGEITYSIVNETPIIVAKEEKKRQETKTFFRNAAGQYAIPGSTMRGLLRNNIQILGMCNPKNDIADTTFLYRDWTSMDKKRKQVYTTAIDARPENKLPGKVKAGYIYQNAQGDFVIKPAKSTHGKTFFYIKEDKLRTNIGDSNKVSYMFQDGQLRIENRQFKPYWTTAYFSTDEKNSVTKVRLDAKDGLSKGMLMCSEYIRGKHAHYIINKVDDKAEPIVLRKESKTIRMYKDDLNRKKFGPKSHSFHLLPERGENNIRPVFYIESMTDISIGMTPYLRILYEHSIHDGIPKKLASKGVDYVHAMFGSTEYRSRVSFTDAVAEGNVKVAKEETAMILGEPKPTWYAGYIHQTEIQNGHFKSYADDNFEIRGIKQYWLMTKLAPIPEGNGNDKVGIVIRPIEKATFKGKIYYENLMADELGLLLFALKVKDGAKQNIGLAKPYGYGKVRVEDISVRAYNFDQLYTSFALDNTSYTEISVDESIEKYKKFVQAEYKFNIDEEPNVQEFLYMKTTEVDPKYVPYMTVGGKKKKTETDSSDAHNTPLGEKGFQKLRILPYATDYVGAVKLYMENPAEYKDFANPGNPGNRNQHPNNRYGRRT